MLMPDVNVLVYAHRQDEAVHEAYRGWLESTLDGPQPLALSVLVAVGFVRIVTNRRIYERPTPTETALATIDAIVSHPRCHLVAPGPSHWDRASGLCRATGATGKLVADAQHAAVAIETGSEWVTRDSDYARFGAHGLRWQHLHLT
jgi:toxin-antitoxin system PIN domain toxin